MQRREWMPLSPFYYKLLGFGSVRLVRLYGRIVIRFLGPGATGE